MEIKTDGSINSIEWNRFSKTNRFATPFQSYEFYVLFKDYEFYRTKAYAVIEGDSVLALCVVTLIHERGLMSRLTRRAIVFGGPLLIEDEIGIEALRFLLAYMKRDIKRKAIYVETRNFGDYSFFKNEFFVGGWNYLNYLDIVIDILNISKEELLKNISGNRRREIMSSVQMGAVYREAVTEEEVEKVYQILKELYRTKVLLPLPGPDFFLKLFSSPIGKVFVVVHNDIVIGGSFCIMEEAGAIYTMYYCGIRDYERKIYPSHLAIMAAIEFGISRSLKAVDLMGAGRPEVSYGVRDYKLQFGGELVEYGRYLLVLHPVAYRLGKLGLDLIKRTHNR